jgi:hypothetical protein
MQPLHFPLVGGLDLVNPAIRTPSGHAIASLNYVPVERGYGRERGFERYDGQPRPSQASYYVLNFDAGTVAIAEGDIVTGATSGATGKALIAGVVSSGSYGGSDAAGHLVLTNVTGTFQDNENLQVSSVTRAMANGTASWRGADNDTEDTTWLRDAIETARALIAAPTGSGPTRGGLILDGVLYVFRDNAGGTAGQIFKATSSGWALQTLGRSLDFTSGGATEIQEGDTITGATSGATATVDRVVLLSGTWAAGTAVGRLIVSSQSGTFVAENLDVGASLNLATIAGNSAQITLPAGGNYEAVIENFFGAANLTRAYFVNGVGTAQEWDGQTLVPIITGMTMDTPNRIEAFSNHLFLTFPGGSLQNSSIGAPYIWNPVTGADEIGLGTDCTGLLDVLESAMVVFGRTRISVLYGDDTNNFVLKRFSSESGAEPGSVQLIGTPLYVDNRGIRSLSTTERYGNFTMGSISRLVEPWIRKKRQAGVTVKASLRSRVSSHYRLFFSDGSGLCVYFGRRQPEIMPFDLGVVVEWAISGEDATGNEVLFFGDSSGMVYQLDVGTSFDGQPVNAFCRLAFNHLGSVGIQKRLHRAMLEVDCAGPTTLKLTAELSYADQDNPTPALVSLDVSGGGGFWNESNYGEFYWSAAAEGTAEAFIDGLGDNVGLAIIHSSTYEEPHVLHGATIFASLGRRG